MCDDVNEDLYIFKYFEILWSFYTIETLDHVLT